MEPPPEQPRQKIPKDGPGPRGVPDCYYTSRVLNSTFRYVKFVKKLRATEEEERKGAEIKLQELQDKQYSDFFIRCDRRSLINNVARRVDLCMASYQEDLKKKRQRLIDLLAREEEDNIRKFVVQVQAGAEAVWQDKQERLRYLLAKRKKEHEDKYKDTPLSKCVHVLPCIIKLRAKEAEEIQLYQIKEKEARKMAEKEFDKMWYEVAMKESDALAARMERDVMDRLRRDLECKKYSDYQLRERQLQRERERERLKQEAIRMKAIWDADIKKEEEEERKRADKRKETAKERDEMIKERQEMLKRQGEADKRIEDTWYSLVSRGQAGDRAKEEMRRRKERELDECNRKMIELREEIRLGDVANDGEVAEVAKAIQEKIDRKRCDYLSWSQKTNRDVRKAMIDQIKDRKEAREVLEQKLLEQDEYHRQLFCQLTALAEHKDVTDAQQRKRHQRQLIEQIEYNKLLKQRKLRQKQLIDQIKDRKEAREVLKKKLLEQDEYHRQLFCQLTALAEHKDVTDAQQRKRHQRQLIEQIEYNKLLKALTNAQQRKRHQKQLIDQIKDRKEAREVLKQKLLEQDEYHRQLFCQLTALAEHKDVTDAQQRKTHQRQLIEQIEYNKLLKERARQEELDQIKKCQIATEEYQEEIKKMLCRPFFSDELHPFMKQMAKGLKMKEKCPCSKPDYCK